MTRCTYEKFRMFLSCSYKLHFIAQEHPSYKSLSLYLFFPVSLHFLSYILKSYIVALIQLSNTIKNMSTHETILSGAGKKKKKRFQINLKQREGTCRRPLRSCHQVPLS